MRLLPLPEKELCDTRRFRSDGRLLTARPIRGVNFMERFLCIINRCIASHSAKSTALAAGVLLLALAAAGLTAAPAHADARDDILIGLEAARRGAHEAAMRYYTKAMESGELSSHDLGMAYKARALSYHDTGHPDKALSDFEQAAKLTPGDPDIYYNRAQILQARGQQEEADKDLQRAAQGFAQRGNAYIDHEKYDAAISDLTKALLFAPDSADLYIVRGLAYKLNGSLDKATDDYTRAIELAPDDPLPYMNRANTLLKAEQYGMALMDYDKAIELDPKYADAYFNRATAYEKILEDEKAVEDYTMAIKINPEDAMAYKRRGELRKGMGQNSLADKDFAKAFKIDPNLDTAN
ncbi:hypothetical protein DPQ33_04780 [Oceanidesulfovibrio indonesiensis]|uniref:Tetratricopeptide repeat protein n=2 Tax=Oceanidesulfovibrio indonesiensis TaxID=54767 RepID=A0A7M3MH30_9BACT|nr:hypothetical protein DPQ33_04780 [Oceanidesulfovibrio indonesiensis]